MVYLKKVDRHNEILKTAIQILIDNGIASITARKIAENAHISVGQIHHHFKSVGQLKAQALLNVIEQLIEKTQQANSSLSTIDKIINIVSPLEGTEGIVMRKLWNEAVFLAERDPDIKQAFEQSTKKWHATLVELINQANEEKVLAIQNADELVWRLIALSCGLDTLATVNEFRFDKETIKNHFIAILK